MHLLVEYDWPGNIRELENLIKRAVVLGAEGPIKKEIAHGIAIAAQKQSSLGAQAAAVSARQSEAARAQSATLRNSQPAFSVVGGSSGTKAHRTPTEIACAAAEAGNYSLKDISRTAAREAERELIFKMLQQTRWNRKETAEILGISYKALLYKIKENGLDKAS